MKAPKAKAKAKAKAKVAAKPKSAPKKNRKVPEKPEAHLCLISFRKASFIAFKTPLLVQGFIPHSIASGLNQSHTWQ